MTIVTRGDDATLEQIVKQLNKLPTSSRCRISARANTWTANWCW